MSLQISPKVENMVRERAAAEGVSVEELLTRTFAPKQNDVPQNDAPIRDPKAHVQALLAQWQAQDNTPSLPPIQTLPGETPTQALFRQWEEEAAAMTEEEKEAEDRLWAELEQGLRQNNRTLRLRTLG
jgi:hypothetical protein